MHSTDIADVDLGWGPGVGRNLLFMQYTLKMLLLKILIKAA